MPLKAKLVLEDGSEFEGQSFGYEKNCVGEVVFNTGMVGYNESLTDPSYSGQILCLTYPLIGNYGVPKVIQENGLIKNFESHKIQVEGLVVNYYSEDYSHYAAQKSLGDWLREERIPAIQGIDVRKLTKILREKGTMLGKIIVGVEERQEIKEEKQKIGFRDPNKENLVASVSTHKTIVYTPKNNYFDKKVLLIDCGVKNNIIHSLLKRKSMVVRVPWDFDFLNKNFEHSDFDAILVSNGPGDPKMCVDTIKNLKQAMMLDKPIFGICLGNQLLALAAGANTYKLKYGHRSQNQPVYDVNTHQCFITSQNHGFAVDEKTLPKDWSVWFRNANDNTNEGIKHNSKPFFSVQFHPEANPGPRDTDFLFDEFLRCIK